MAYNRVWSGRINSMGSKILAAFPQILRLGVFWCLVIQLSWASRLAATPADDLLKSLRPSADVNDYAGLLTPAEKNSLEARCRLLRQRTGAQLAVVTIKSLEGGQIDDFAVKLFKQWGVGEKDKKNGILLLVAVADRKIRIEVGYGLEPIIPDALAGRIIDHQIRPRFRNQQYAAGLSEAVESLCSLVEKGEPAANQVAKENSSADQLAAVLFLALFVAVGGFLAGLGLGLPRLGWAIFGLLFGGFAIALGFAAAGAVALVVHLILSIISGVLGWSLAKNAGGGKRGRAFRTPTWNWGNFYGGNWTSGGGWSGGGGTSGGGGFSQGWGGFGGGSSGGGGASGGW